jgi:hypothetical protein
MSRSAPKSAFKPGDARINRGGRPKKHRKLLEELIGEGGEEGYRELKRIAQGQVSYKKLVREPSPHEDSLSAAHIPYVEVFPDWKLRAEIWMFLVEQLNGKAPSSLEVSGTVTHEHEHNLSEETLSKMPTEQLERLAGHFAAIEAEFAVAEGEEAAPALPSHTLTPELKEATVSAPVEPVKVGLGIRFFKG